MKIILSILILLFTEQNPPSDQAFLPTTLHVTVMDENDAPLEGVNVYLYETKEDYLNSLNKKDSLVTNSKGIVKFKKLTPSAYFIEARKGDLSNDALTAETEKLQEGKINKVGLVIK